MSELATREQLFGTAKRRYAEVALPASGLTVRIQSLSERERAGFQAAFVDNKGNIRRERILDAGRRLIVLCVVDGAGNRVLSDADVPRLAEWDAADTQHLYDKCQEHTGITTTNSETEADEKNSATTDAAA